MGRRGYEGGVLRTKERDEQTLRELIDQEEALMREAFKVARNEVRMMGQGHVGVH
jgi:hypothetical protein